MTRQMLCEGPCNPKLPALDMVLTLEREAVAKMLRLGKGAHQARPMLTTEFLNDQAKLKHTDHELKHLDPGEGDGRWVCSVCGTGRL